MKKNRVKLFGFAALLITTSQSMAQAEKISKPYVVSAGYETNLFNQETKEQFATIADTSAEDILKKAIKAYGGEKAIAALKDIQMTGSVSVMGQSLEYMQKNVFPSGFATTVSMAGSPIMKQLKKDTTYEMQMPGGADLGGEIDAAAKEEIDTRAAFFSERYMLANPGYTYTLKGTEQVAGKDAYVITVLSPKGSESTLYYDVTSGLKVQEKRESASPMGGGTMNIITSFTEYKTFEGITIPTKLTIDLGQFSQEIIINEVKVNQGLKLSDL